jgi:hypothetical protein
VPPEEQTQLGFFEIAIIGVPLLLSATVYIILASPYLLPDRVGSLQKYVASLLLWPSHADVRCNARYVENPREFTTVVRVEPVRAHRAVRAVDLANVPVLRDAPPLFLCVWGRGGEQTSPHVGASLEQTGLLTMTNGNLYRVQRGKQVCPWSPLGQANGV